MFTKLSFRNASIFALIVLFATISLFPMGLSADHDNLIINDVYAQTSLGLLYIHPYVKSGSYANIWNASNIPVRYYWSDQLAVYRKGSVIPFRFLPDSDKGSVNPGDWKSFLPGFLIDMSDAKAGEYTASGSVELGLKFDFNGDNVWDDGGMVSSSEVLKFEIEDD